MNTGFLKLTLDFAQIGIFKKRPTALLLLLLIAKRAKRSNDHPDKELEIGESWIGDWAYYCHSERCYRTDKKWLEKYQIVTTKVTSKGTTAKIVGTSYVDINPEKVTSKVTDKRRTSDGQVTTNKIEKIEKTEKNIYMQQDTSSELKRIIEDIDKSQHIRTEHQYLGLELHAQLKAPQDKKGELIRIVRDYPRNKVDQARSFAADYSGTAPKWKMFFWKLNILMKNK